MAEGLGNVKYITETEICTTQTVTKSHVYTALGYPNSQNKKVDNNNKRVSGVILPYSATALDETDSMALERKLDITGDDHIYIKFRKYSKNAITGNKVKSIKPQGISGGALIDLGNIANLDNLAKPSNGGCLIGLLIEHDSEYKAMVATRMSVILREIKQRV